MLLYKKIKCFNVNLKNFKFNYFLSIKNKGGFMKNSKKVKRGKVIWSTEDIKKSGKI